MGILIGLYLKNSIVFLCAILVCIAIIGIVYSKSKIWIVIIIFTLLGSVYINVLDIKYEEKYSNISQKVKIKATIISEPKDKEYKYTYTIKVIDINNEKKYKNTKLILDINKNKLKNNILKFGDVVEIIGQFERASSKRNYKGFDYKKYLKSKKIYGTVQLENYKIIGSNNINTISKIINNVQNSMKYNMKTILGKEESALCIGILLGDREEISEKTEDEFKRSNLTHLLAVSGAHITYIVTGLAIILSKTSKRFTKIFTLFFLLFFMALTGFTASVVRASIMGMMILIANIIHANSDTLNNLGISSFIILLINPYMVTDIGFILSFGGTIGIILLSPKITNVMYKIVEKLTNNKMIIAKKEDSTENNGEVCALGKEFYLNRKKEHSNKENKDRDKTKKESYREVKKESIKQRIVKYTINAFSITLSANLIIIPIMAYIFSTFSFTFWISNILAAPIMEVTTIIGFIVYFISIFFIPGAKFLGIILNFFLDIMLKIAEISSFIPGSCIYIKTPFIIECIIYYIILFIIFNIRYIKIIIKRYIRKKTKQYKISNYYFLSFKFIKDKYTIIFIIILSIIATIVINVIKPNMLQIFFIDVGQGDSTLIITPSHKKILVDGGGNEYGSFDVGESTLLPYLLDRRITTLDFILISHFDSDHVKGLFAVIENIKVKNIIISKQGENSENFQNFQKLIQNKKINIIVAEKGTIIRVDKYSYFEILFPEANLIKENILNNNSIVTNFHCMEFSMLFTGDIEDKAEKIMLELYKNTDKLNATILKVPHHGSKTSSTKEFLEEVKPKIVLIGVGENNKFGHPNMEVIERLKKYTSLIYRTDECGEVEIIIKDKTSIKIKKCITK